jgi:hypothetical protein
MKNFIKKVLPIFIILTSVVFIITVINKIINNTRKTEDETVGI